MVQLYFSSIVGNLRTRERFPYARRGFFFGLVGMPQFFLGLLLTNQKGASILFIAGSSSGREISKYERCKYQGRGE